MSSKSSALSAGMHPLAQKGDAELSLLLAYFEEQALLEPPLVRITDSQFNGGTLRVVNYTDTYNSLPVADMDDRMLAARGLVFHIKSGSVRVAVFAMPKFHSHHRVNGMMLERLDGARLVEVMPKHDGSMVSIAIMNSEILTFTRATRSSNQAVLALDLLNEEDKHVLRELEGYSLVVELIHHMDAKVETNRGADRLVMLYGVDPTGRILSPSGLKQIAEKLSSSVEAVERETVSVDEVLRRITALDQVKILSEVREGFVVELEGIKLKVKSSLYLKVAAAPRPSAEHMLQLLMRSRSVLEVESKVDAMSGLPLDFGSTGRALYDDILNETNALLLKSRDLVPSYETPGDLGRDRSVDEAVKHVMFQALKLPVAQRIAYLDAETTALAVAKQVAKNIVDRSPRTLLTGQKSPKNQSDLSRVRGGA